MTAIRFTTPTYERQLLQNNEITMRQREDMFRKASQKLYDDIDGMVNNIKKIAGSMAQLEVRFSSFEIRVSDKLENITKRLEEVVKEYEESSSRFKTMELSLNKIEKVIEKETENNV